MIVVSCTGHRPDKLPNKETGYILPNPTYISVCQQTEKILKEINPDKCISGMALGYDSYFANVCIKLGIPFIAAVPFLGQEKMWPEKSKRVYFKLLEKAESVIVVSEGAYSAKKMQIRNEFLVNQCSILVACIRKSETNGGTYNCLQYARSLNKKIITVDPEII